MSENGEPPCFPAGTPVELEAGPAPIEDVKVGDQVVTLRDGHRVLTPVLGVKVRRTDRVLVFDLGGSSLSVTPEHPIWLNAQWRPAYEAQVDDVFTGLDGPVRILGVRLETGDVEVRTLRVGAPHSFFAQGVWVHNY